MKKPLQLITLLTTFLAGAAFSQAADGNDLLIVNNGDGSDFLESRGVMATFDERSGVLMITGDANDNVILASLGLDGSILVNEGEVPIVGGAPNLNNTALVMIDGGEGNDLLIGDDVRAVAMRGGSGMDLLVWDNGGDTFYESNDGRVDSEDRLIWTHNTTSASGGSGNDVLLGDRGNDRVEEGESETSSSSDDIYIGSLGNDWIVGGTHTKDPYIGDGNDVLLGDRGDIDYDDSLDSDGILSGWGSDWTVGDINAMEPYYRDGGIYTITVTVMDDTDVTNLVFGDSGQILD